MRVDLPSRFRNTNVALVLQLDVDFFIIGILVGNHGLLILSWNCISVGEMPGTISIGFVVTETTLVVCSIGEQPSPFDDLILSPFSH